MLKVMIPGTKDFRDQGLGGTEWVNNGVTIYDEGKLGKCLYSDTTSSMTATDFSISSVWSYSCWWKDNDTSLGWQYIFLLHNGTNNDSNSQMAFLSNPAQSRCEVCSNGKWFSSQSYTPGIWNHIAATYDGTTCEVYFNGVHTRTFTPEQTIVGVSLQIFKNANVYINDLRIWDNQILSPKEIYDLSKALILHYPFSRDGFGADNLLKNSMINITTSTYAIVDSIIPDPMPEDGDTVTIQIKGKLGVNRTHWGVYNSGGTQTLVNMHPEDCYNEATGIYTATFNWKVGSSSNTFLKIYHMPSNNTNTSTIEWVKLEKGSVATPWIPHPTDSLYSAIGLGSNIIYDVSGHQNNGEIIGELSYNSETPRYKVCTHFGLTNSHIRIDNLTTVGFGNSYSFAWWAKINSFDYMCWGFLNGIRLNGIFKGVLWNTGDSGGNPLYIPGTTTQVSSPTLNVWHHWVMTGDGTTCKVYQDGELFGVAKTYKSISGTIIFINGWANNASYASDDLSISDFRIYATCLSAADVAALYNTPISLSSNGVLFSNELSEV